MRQATLSDLNEQKREAKASTVHKLAQMLRMEPKELMKRSNDD